MQRKRTNHASQSAQVENPSVWTGSLWVQQGSRWELRGSPLGQTGSRLGPTGSRLGPTGSPSGLTRHLMWIPTTRSHSTKPVCVYFSFSFFLLLIWFFVMMLMYIDWFVLNSPSTCNRVRVMAFTESMHHHEPCASTVRSHLHLTHWPLGDLKEILFEQIVADFREWWLGYLWWSCT